MLKKQALKILNQHGRVTWAQLACWLRLTKEEARLLLQEIVSEYENVDWISEGAVAIEGAHIVPVKAKNKSYYRKKPKKWKDVTKP